MEEHVEAVNALLKDINGPRTEAEVDEEEWFGIEDDEPLVEDVDYEEEYVDEDKYTTVTVETVDISKDGLVRVADEDSEDETPESDEKPVEKELAGKKIWPKKTKKKKFRYESKVERRITRGKQKAEQMRS